MFLIERLSKGIARNVTKNMDCNEDKQAVIEYGAFCLLQTLWGVLMVSLIAIIFNVLIEGLIVCFSISILRKYSGGVHASTPNSCALIGGIICVILSIFSINISMNLNWTIVVIVSALGLVYSYYLINVLAPVDSPAKPIKKEEKRIRLKRQSKNVLLIMYSLSCILLVVFLQQHSINLLKYSLCIQFGLIWQSFTLTQTAHIIIKKIDYIVVKIFSLFNRKN